MSPELDDADQPDDCPPRASGDEPRSDVLRESLEQVRPARAGMSPPSTDRGPAQRGPPRASGDEPSETQARASGRESAPRERG